MVPLRLHLSAVGISYRLGQKGSQTLACVQQPPNSECFLYKRSEVFPVMSEERGGTHHKQGPVTSHIGLVVDGGNFHPGPLLKGD